MSTPARRYYPDEPAPEYSEDEPPPAYEPEYSGPANLAWVEQVSVTNPPHKEEQFMPQSARRPAFPLSPQKFVPQFVPLPTKRRTVAPVINNDPSVAARAIYEIKECAELAPPACRNAMRSCNREQLLELEPSLETIERSVRYAKLEIKRMKKVPPDVPRLFDDDDSLI